VTGGNSGVTGGNSGVTGGNSGVTGGNSGVTGGNSGVTGGTSGVTGGSGGSTGGSSGSDLDQNGKAIACAGDSTAVAQDYLRLGEIRILNNNWGSEDLGCSNSSMDVFVEQSGAFGWNFSRGDCAANGDGVTTFPDTSHPDFPQVEFGINPFGIGDPDVTSPEFSSTTLLPAQLSTITSASMTLDNLNISLSQSSSWNLAMEFWLSTADPRQPTASVDVHTELMAWWGWNTNRWECGTTDNNSGPPHGDTVSSSGRSYVLCHQSDNWANGKWRYYQFRAGNGDNGSSSSSFNGTIDVGAFIDYLVNSRGYSRDLWLTRLEVGSEIDDDTAGTVRMNGITFEVNGETRSAVLCQ
jgi:hypothetical protein